MATPMTPAQVVSQLKKWGVPYKEYRSWKTHNRNHKGAWGPVNGFMVHHTGSDAKDQRELLYNGISGLPGPLCHFGLAQDGTVHLIGWGRANHAGAGDPDVLSAVIDERPAPTDNQSSVDFNSRFYGVEIWYSGNHEMTDAQYKTLLKLSAAVLDFHGWGKYSVIGHGESGSPGKWDPGYAPGKMMNMEKVRTDVGSALNSGPRKSNPGNSNSEENTMSGFSKQDVGNAVWQAGISAPDNAPDRKTRPNWWAGSYIRAIYGTLVTLLSDVSGLRRDIAALRNEVASLKSGSPK